MVGLSLGANYVIRPTANINLDTVNISSPSSYADTLNLIDTITFDTTKIVYNFNMTFNPGATVDSLNDSATIALFKFDEGSGSITRDSKNGINATMYNTSWAANANGYGVNFNGTNSYITTKPSAFTTIKDTFTIDIIFKANTTSQRIFFIGMRYLESLGIEIGADGKISVGVFSRTTFTRLDGTNRVDDNNWHSLTVVNRKPTLYLYVDGVLDAQSTNPLLNVNNKNNITIGHFNIDEFPGKFFYNGVIDMIRFSRIARNSSEITKIYTISQSN